MPPLRSRVQPAPRSLPRDTLPATAVPVVDSGLKALRSATKRVHSAAGLHNVELNILVRLHYKNNNQHRGALFWRRLEHLKRIATRLDELGLPSLLEGVKLAFHSPDAGHTNAKKIKNAWTRAPDADYLAFVLERVHSAGLLIDASTSNYRSIYSFFAQTAAGGAFLSLMLVLSAMTSRIALLLDELRDALLTVWNALKPVYDCVEAISPASHKPPSLFPEPLDARSAIPKESTLAADEDLGEALARPDKALTTDALANVDPSLLEEPTIDIFGVNLEEPPVPESRIETVMVSGSIPVVAAKPKLTKKKKRAKKDEIDLIFG